MRTRIEITKVAAPDDSIPVENDVLITLQAVLEVLLDIRDILSKKELGITPSQDNV